MKRPASSASSRSPDAKKRPRIEVKDEKGKTQKRYLLPSDAHLMVEDGADVSPGDILAKIPRQTAKTKDITGSAAGGGALGDTEFLIDEVVDKFRFAGAPQGGAEV